LKQYHKIKVLKLKHLLKKNLFIFDFDGVICNSVNIKTDAFFDLYSTFGPKIADQVKSHHIENGGMSRYEKISLYHKEFLNVSPSAEDINEFANNFSELVFKKVVSAELVDGVLSFLDLLRNNGKICAINSATPEYEIRKIIKEKDLDKYFFKVFGSPNTKSENLIKIINSTDFNKEETIFFGDAVNDLHAALKEKVDFIGVGEEIITNEQFRKSDYFHIRDFKILFKE
tara:strand:- start:19462 stop:20148 length:687 start_codon:yes stop_codon:yes gene_type:complete